MAQSAGYRPTRAVIDVSAIETNVNNLNKHLPAGTAVIAVVKADGYGHGAAETAKAALRAGASMVSTATPDEALELREAGIASPILVMGPSPIAFAEEAIRRQITLTVPGLDWAEQTVESLKDSAGKLHVHVKIDTGMGRIGIRTEDEAAELASLLGSCPAIQVDGAFTHFACADEEDPTKTEQQYNRFLKILARFPDRPPCVHAANSAAALRFPEYALDAVRFGISMYGIPPSSAIASRLPFPLRRAMQLETETAYVKQAGRHETISYGSTYEAPEGEWIATLPIGYADGLKRSLRGQQVLIRGQRAPIVGTICMDQCMIRLPGQLPYGEPVVLIGSQGSVEITMEEWAERLGTIPYEIAVTIAGRVQRQYVGE
ncbi:alanine racemase 1 [Sporosarcina sp. NCCP-2716]|uniref:alanine racemase n=1 Tax=Sporosarcina sp. NCCP-2716 TaxID=2943679 RepID=UPI0020405977|nr:alanine racemase [Sporosarcina sp. NCCP-2716]GKV68264.1 alanine racemase 1 [Sporosarcina sp. NCCP-2716]